MNSKKKILIFINEFPVLSETFIERDISQLASFGNLDLTVLYTKLGSGQMSKNVSDIAFLRRLTIYDSFLGVFLILRNLRRFLRCVSLINRDKTKTLFPRLFLLLKSVGYARIFFEYRPQEIHAHFMNDTSTIAMIAGELLGIPFSINAHARDVTEYPTLLVEKCRRAKFVTLCNKNAFNVCCSYCEDVSRVHLTYHGLRPEIFSAPLIIEKPSRLVISPGGTRLTEKKGLEYLIRASRLLLDKGIDHQVELLGSGPEYTKLVQLVAELGLENNVYFRNGGKGTPFSEVIQFYKITDIFVLPSVNMESGDADGIPNTVLEAALNKLPIIATDAGSLLEVVIDGETGIVVPQRDHVSLSDAVEKMLRDKDLTKQLGENAYTLVEEMFGPENTVKKLEQLLLA